MQKKGVNKLAECMLTERIIFEQFDQDETNENGFVVESWMPYYKCWARKEEFSGKEFIKAHATHSQILVGFTVRMCQKIKDILATYETKKYRIIHRGNVYDIKYCYDVKNKHAFADFKCELVKICQP